MKRCCAILLAAGLLLGFGGTGRAALVGWWTFDEAGGTTASDGSGSPNQHDAALVNGASFGPYTGQFGGAMWLDGDNDLQQFAEVADHDDLEFAAEESFSVSVWYKRNGVENDQGLITKGYHEATRNPAGYYQLQTRQDGFCYDSRQGAGADPRTRVDDNSSVSHGDNQWHQFVVVRDSVANELRVYVDNQADPQIYDMGLDDTNGDWAVGVHDDPLVIGNHHARFTRGYFDDIGIWKGEALNAAQIDTIFNKGVAGLVYQTLTWGGAGDGQWGDTAYPHSPAGLTGWKLGDDFVDWYPDVGTPAHAIINTDTVSVVADRSAVSLEVNSGGIRIAGNANPELAATLTVDGSASFAPGTTLELETNAGLNVVDSLTFGAGNSLGLGTGATISARDGNIVAAAAAGDVNIQVHNGLLTVGTYDETAKSPGTLAKQGSGTLSLGTFGAGAADTTLRIEQGTLEISGSPNPTLPDNPIGLWTFDNINEEGEVVNEGSAPEYSTNGLLGGDAVIGPGLFGDAVWLDGSGDFVDVGNDPSMNFHEGNWTLAAWVQSTNSGTGDANKGVIFGNGGDTEGGIRYAMIVSEQNEGRVTALIDDDATSPPGSAFDKQQAAGATVVNDGPWHHVAAVREGGELRVYVDGKEDGSASFDASYNLEGIEQHNAYMGAITEHNEPPDESPLYKFFSGGIDQVAVYGSALSDAEIEGMVGLQDLDMRSHDVEVAGVGTLRAVGTDRADFRTLRLYDGAVLTTEGVPISFRAPEAAKQGDTIIDPLARNVGLDPQVVTDYGVINGSSADVVVSKVGGSSMMLVTANQNLESATFRVEQGRITMVGPDPWGGSTAMSLAGGTFEIVGVTTPAYPDDKVGLWTFDNIDGDTGQVVDEGGAAPANGTLGGGALIVPGLVGDAVALDGMDDHVDLGNPAKLDFLGGNFSLSAWIKTPTEVSSVPDCCGQSIVSKGGNWDHDDRPGIRWFFNIGEDGARGRTHLSLDNDAAKVNTVGNTYVTDDAWHHVVAVRDGRTVRLYVDGELDQEAVDTLGAGYSLDTSEFNAFIGAIADSRQADRRPARFFQGLIDEVSIYADVLTEEEIAALMGIPDLNMTGHTVEVTGAATLQVSAADSAAFGTLTMKDGGILTTSGAPMSFHEIVGRKGGDTLIEAPGPDPVAVGFDPQTGTDLGAIEVVGPAAVTITKYGGGQLVLDENNVNLSNTVFDAQGGQLVFRSLPAKDDTAMKDARLRINGGETVLSGLTTDGSVLYDNAVEVVADGVLTAGAAGNGTTGTAVTLGSIDAKANPMALTSGIVALRSVDDYTLTVGGDVSGAGGLSVGEGDVTLAATVDVGSLAVTGGKLTTPNGATATDMTVYGGELETSADLNVTTGRVNDGVVTLNGNRIVVSNNITVGDVPMTISGAPDFAVSGTIDGQSAELINVYGGRLTMGGPAMPEGLLSWYSLDEVNPGDLWVTDDSGNAHDLELRGGAPTPSGIFGTPALSFDGSSDAIDQDAGDYLNGQSELTVAMWIKSNDIGVDRGFWEMRDSGDQDQWGGRYDEDGGQDDLNVFKFAVTTSESGGDANRGEDQYESARNLQTAEWQHVAMTWRDGEGFKLYVDNALDVPTEGMSNTAGTVAMVDRFTIGDGCKANWQGLVDDVFIFGRALSQQEIGQLYDGVIGSTSVDLSASTLLVTADASPTSELTGPSDVILGGLTIAEGVDRLRLRDVPFTIADVTTPAETIVEGNVVIRGNLNVGGAGGVGTLNMIGGFELVTDDPGTPEYEGNAIYHCEIGSSDPDSIVYPQQGRPYFESWGYLNDKVVVSRSDAYLDGELKLPVLDKLAPKFALDPDQEPPTMVEWYGFQTRTIIEMGTEDNTAYYYFGTVPEAQPEEWHIQDGVDPDTGDPFARNWEQGHLGYGVFLTRQTNTMGDDDPDDDLPDQPGINYYMYATQVNLFQAASGDTNGDRLLTSEDIQNILGFGEYLTGEPATWPEGNFNGHQDPDDPDLSGLARASIPYCDSYDIQLILATNLWPPGDPAVPYAEPPKGKLAGGEVELLVVPGEDGTFRLQIDTHGLPINSYAIYSADGALSGQQAANLGLFTQDDDFVIAGAGLSTLLDGVHDLGAVIGPGFDGLEGLSLTYTVHSAAGLYGGQVVMVPEPGTVVMLLTGALGLLLLALRRRSA